MPKRIDQAFVDATLETYMKSCVKVDADPAFAKLIEVMAKQNMDLFRIAFNKLIEEGYFD